MNAVTFPQPEVAEPKFGAPCWHVISSGSINSFDWDSGNYYHLGILESRNLYLTRTEAEQRAAWDKQEMARLVAPKWFRDLGPDVQSKDFNGNWVDVPAHIIAGISEWDNVDPCWYRTKPKPAPDVVVTVNGLEYRWPATVEPGDHYRVMMLFVCAQSDDGKRFTVRESSNFCSGNRTHYTREGAEAQCAALNTVLGVKQGEA